MPPEDKVRVTFTQDGADDVASKSDNVAESLEKVAQSGGAATESNANLEQGMSALSGVAGQVDPKLGFLVSTLNTLKVGATGAAGAAGSLVAALKAMIAALGGPVILGAAAVFFLISRAIGRASAETERLNRAMKENEERIKAQREARKEEFESDRERGLRQRADIERELARAGKDPALAPNVISRAGETARREQIPIADAVQRELLRTIVTAPGATRQQRVAGLRRGASGELLERDIDAAQAGQRAAPRRALAVEQRVQELEDAIDQANERLKALFGDKTIIEINERINQLEREVPDAAIVQQGRDEQRIRDRLTNRLNEIQNLRQGVGRLSPENEGAVQRIQNNFYGPVNLAPDQFNPANGPGPARRRLN